MTCPALPPWPWHHRRALAVPQWDQLGPVVPWEPRWHHPEPSWPQSLTRTSPAPGVPAGGLVLPVHPAGPLGGHHSRVHRPGTGACSADFTPELIPEPILEITPQPIPAPIPEPVAQLEAPTWLPPSLSGQARVFSQFTVSSAIFPWRSLASLSFWSRESLFLHCQLGLSRPETGPEPPGRLCPQFPRGVGVPRCSLQ